MGILTLPLKNVSLAEWFNSDKENGNDENIKGALYARIQARGSPAGGQAARLLGGGPVAFSKYENDDVAQSESMDNLLRLLRLVRRSAEAFWQLVEEKGMSAEFTSQAELATMKRSAQIYVFNEHLINSKKPVYKPVQLHGYSLENHRWN